MQGVEWPLVVKSGILSADSGGGDLSLDAPLLLLEGTICFLAPLRDTAAAVLAAVKQSSEACLSTQLLWYARSLYVGLRLNSCFCDYQRVLSHSLLVQLLARNDL